MMGGGHSLLSVVADVVVGSDSVPSSSGVVDGVAVAVVVCVVIVEPFITETIVIIRTTQQGTE